MTPAPGASHDSGRSRDGDRSDRAIATRAARDAGELTEAFERAARRVRRQRAGGATGTPISDPEAVHDLRVATRRLLSALSLLRPVLRKSQRNAAARALREVRRAFGPVRELEVHAGHARVLGRSGAAAAAERTAIAALERSLSQRYPRARAKALATISSRRVRDVSRNVAQAFEGIRHRWAKPRRRARVAGRLENAHANALHAFRAAREPGLAAESEAFHRARIAIKKWRYVTERNAQATGVRDAPIERLRELQSALGHAHDAITFAGEIARFTARSKPRQSALESVSAVLHAKAKEYVGRFLERASDFETFETPQPAETTGTRAKSRRKRVAGKSGARTRAVSSRKPSSPAAASSRGSSPGT